LNKWGVDFKRYTTWGVIAFLILAVFMLFREARSEGTGIELAPGTMFVASDRYKGAWLGINHRFTEEDKWEIGLGLTTEWQCVDINDCPRGEGSNNQFIYGQRIIHWNKFELGLGISYWHNKTPAWDSHTPYALSLGWNFTDNIGVGYRHFSTAGSSTNNGGLDMLTARWRF
jgi:hypothetical protein